MKAGKAKVLLLKSTLLSIYLVVSGSSGVFAQWTDSVRISGDMGLYKPYVVTDGETLHNITYTESIILGTSSGIFNRAYRIKSFIGIS